MFADKETVAQREQEEAEAVSNQAVWMEGLEAMVLRGQHLSSQSASPFSSTSMELDNWPLTVPSVLVSVFDV